MKKILFSLLAAIGLVTAFSIVRTASAADVFAGQLTSNDAGGTNILTIIPQQRYSIECNSEACYQVDSAAQAWFFDGGCGNRYVLPQVTGSTSTGNAFQTFTRDFDTGTGAAIAAMGVDGGNITCNVFRRFVNPTVLQ